jgi:hypothetical protein
MFSYSLQVSNLSTLLFFWWLLHDNKNKVFKYPSPVGFRTYVSYTPH